MPVGVLNPAKHPNPRLVSEASFVKKIRAGVLRASQFPKELSDNDGQFHQPETWHAVPQFLRLTENVVRLLKEGARNDADRFIKRMPLLAQNIAPDDPLYEDCLVINTMVRDYWNGIPTIDIADLEKSLKSALARQV